VISRTFAARSFKSHETGLQALLVTDLVAFTNLVLALGDVRARHVMRAHNRMLRRCLSAYAGREVTHTGDGMFGTFRSVRGALDCAVAIRGAVDEAVLGAQLQIRIGLHLGEPLLEEQRLFGACVNTAVRICSAAEAGTILASDVVRQAAVGHSVEFSDRGSFQLKGLTRTMQLYEVARRPCNDVRARVNHVYFLERETGRAV
jgi:class 3 adenylate cyclase